MIQVQDPRIRGRPDLSRGTQTQTHPCLTDRAVTTDL